MKDRVKEIRGNSGNKIILRQYKGITYEILQEKDLNNTIRLISEVFSQGEPMTKALNITPKEFQSLAEIYSKKAVEEGLSIIAKDNDKVIGFIIAEDFDSTQPEEIKNIDKKVVPWMALIDEVEKDAKSNKNEDERRFHLFLGGTDKQYENKHINTTMIEEIMKLAQIKNFTSVMVEPTGFATQHMFKDNFGFEQKFIIEYKNFLYQGKKVFENIEGPVGLLLLEKNIVGVNL
jgi:ribosomal protein S18 acetylase RimI-like enzyme